MSPSPEQHARLSRKTIQELKQIWSTASPPLFPDVSLFAFIPFAVLLYMVGAYYLILAPGNLYNALVSEDWVMFRKKITSFSLWATFVLVMKVTRGMLRESSANYMRKRLTAKLHDLYFGKADQEMAYGASPYYRASIERKLDNPDQRIVADAREFSSSLVNIVAGGSEMGADTGGLLESSASIVFYSYKTLLRTGWYGILVAYLWSMIVGLLSIYVINRTSPAVFKQEMLEADFRYGHTELRRYAEEVAFMRGAPFEKRKLSRRLDRAVSNMWVVIVRHVFLNFVQYGFGYYISLVMYLALALAVHTNVFSGPGTTFSSDMTPGEKAQWISQTGGIFIQLLFAFTMAIQLGTAISVFVTNTSRVSTLIAELKKNTYGRDDGTDTALQPLISRDYYNGPNAIDGDVSAGIAADDLCLHLGSKTKIGPISFSMKEGEWLLIDGPSGSGKTSILRALRGLWIPSSGSTRIPTDENAVMFVPQVPYISSGMCSLRELVVYPQRCSHSAEETSRVVSALMAVGWRRGDPRNVVDTVEEWSARLSPGEAQLVAIARVLERRPRYAVLDEPTSSMDSASEKRVLSALKEAGVCVLTVGHRRSLPALHDRVVSIKHSDE